ncbi:uncharacterized protein BCR38DRAFT_450559 [Pseudomassariella vexata]|uniref:NAD(P)-binding domain-containing protein n=1 Tax=Pseudomassariella vexata TaxID=1141098 RepID=A0A1Y2DD15_9PEZI|nr:uncharacterized protein BCR38DRAFT_450559 [Pseudomassariella vexata]ORY57006.1 hypothetical protein BCR38DRAFT_450559 [Pseudomassariella vexata]
MKLIIAGASGFVGSNVVRQSLQLPKITTVVALARRPIEIPETHGLGADPAKLKSIVIEDYEKVPDEAMKELENADACIWTVGLTPSKANELNFKEVRRLCYDSTLAWLQAISKARSSSPTQEMKPLRFIYVSGSKAERDQTKRPFYLGQYSLLRGEVETAILQFAQQHKEHVEACIVKPGLIISPGDTLRQALGFVLKWTTLGAVDISDFSAAMLSQATDGIEKDTLQNDDLARIGKGKF